MTFKPREWIAANGTSVLVDSEDCDETRLCVAYDWEGLRGERKFGALFLDLEDAEKLGDALQAWVKHMREDVSCPLCVPTHSRSGGCDVCDDGFMPRHRAIEIEAEMALGRAVS